MTNEEHEPTAYLRRPSAWCATHDPRLTMREPTEEQIRAAEAEKTAREVAGERDVVVFL